MKTLIIISSLAVAALLIGAGLRADSAAQQPAQKAKLILEGERLVEKVSLCTDCHTPHLPDGSLDRVHWLQGSALPFKPVVNMPWADAAPPIAGLQSFTEEQAIRFLMTGERPSGVPPRPPMPAFRFNESEARALVAYLKSLKGP